MTLYHVTYRGRDGAIHTGRVSGEGSTPSAARRDAIRSATARYNVAAERGAILSAVAIPRPRAVTPYPKALTPGG